MPSQEPPRPDCVSPEKLLGFLRDPHSYPHHPERVAFLQTHASYVFVVPPYVYKVKKPVNFGFLDYSTLERRKHFCEQEVALNRELCPEAYLGVIPIVRENGSLRFAGEGEPVEYAVRMAQLSEEFFAKRLLLQGRFGKPELDRVAERLATFYRGQRPEPSVLDWGRVDKLRITSDENFAQTEGDIGKTIDRTTWETLRFFTDEFYRQRSALFEQRVREGWIKSGHGDLHLEHIHISPAALCIYDRIEFNDRFRSVDVASDAAFLAMDLAFQGHLDLGRYFLEQMARRLDDPVVAVASGWMRVRQRAKASGVELPLIISDHADWDELLATVIDVQAPEIWVTHGNETALIYQLGRMGRRGRALSLIGYGDEGNDT